MSTEHASERRGLSERVRALMKPWYVVVLIGSVLAARDLSIAAQAANVVVTLALLALLPAAYRRLVDATGRFHISERRWQLIAVGALLGVVVGAGGYLLGVVVLTLFVGGGGWVYDWVRADPGTGDAATV